ncbi:MAG: hypothetical protein SGPRY_012263, partial [Prymnesium sp.]
SVRHSLRAIVFESDTSAGATFDLLLLLAILVSVLAVVLESVPQLRHRFGQAFRISEYAFTSAFMCEYLLRLAVAPSPLAYASSFFGIIDATSILPTFVDLVVRCIEPSNLPIAGAAVSDPARFSPEFAAHPRAGARSHLHSSGARASLTACLPCDAHVSPPRAWESRGRGEKCGEERALTHAGGTSSAWAATMLAPSSLLCALVS